MRNTVLLLTLLYGNLSRAQGLPFTTNYTLPLKLMSTAHFNKYEYEEYTAGDDIVQLKRYPDMNREKSLKMMDDRKFFLDAMFKDQPSPYPGVLSSAIGCPPDKRPKSLSDTLAVKLNYKLLATGNLIYGNCNPSDNFYYCLYSLFFCEGKQEMYELKIFTPMAKPSFDFSLFNLKSDCKE
jgi:hypothetical protein